MPAMIDAAALAGALHEAPETRVDQREREGISPYLLETILPMLEREAYPRLREIDFERFEADDPPQLAWYIQARTRRAYRLTELNRRLCELPPACGKTRAFL